jgi:hypothetical protein
MMLGTLVDAMITEPWMVDYSTMSVKVENRYSNTRYFFEEAEFAMAVSMKNAFFNHSFCKRIVRYGKKQMFYNESFDFQGLSIETEGEADILFRRGDIILDVKVTASDSEHKFYKTVRELFYDQQGAWYMDNFNINRFVCAGISRKSLVKGVPEIYLYPMKRGHRTYNEGRDRYLYWLGLFLQSQTEIVNYADQSIEVS